MVLITPYGTMANIGKVVIIGTVLWWSWSTLAQWSSLAQCFGCHGQHWHNGHHWHSVLVVMDIIGTVDIIDTVFWLSWTSLAQCLVAMVNIGTMVIIGTVVNIGTVDIIGTVFWWPWSTLAQWFRGTKHWCFLWCWPAQALKQLVKLHPVTFLHRGSFVRGLRPIPAAVWISFSLTGKSFWTNSRSASDLLWKLCFWRGYPNIDVFFGVGLHKLLNNQLSCIQWQFCIEGRGNQVHSPHNDAVWISYSFVVNLKNLLNKQLSCSRFTTKAVFWKGY